MWRWILFMMLGVIVPATILAVAVPEAANGTNPYSQLTDLIVTTHNPSCTAVFLEHMGVTRLTDVRPYYNGTFGYSNTAYSIGINVTAVTLTTDANRTVSAILERPEVSVVTARLSVLPNATNSERPAPPKTYANLDAEISPPGSWPPYTPCDVMRTWQTDIILNQLGWTGSPYPNVTALAGAVVQAAARDDATWNHTVQNHTARNYTTKADLDPSPAYPDRYIAENGIVYYGDLMSALIETTNIPETWAYLKRNGAHVYALYQDDNSTVTGALRAYIPPSLVWGLLERDEVTEVVENNYHRIGLGHWGNIKTQGLGSVHPNVQNWHDHGYNGTDIKVGVIDAGFNLALAKKEIPALSSKHCYPSCMELTTGSTFYDSHGTGVAEILMDMAPGVDLYLAKPKGFEPRDVHDAVDWLIVNKTVDIITMSINYDFEGPGDGTSPLGKSRKSILYAVDRAVDADTLWINAAGNYADGQNWTANITDKNWLDDTGLVQKLGPKRPVMFNY